jgi:hypothetical protein
MTQDEIRKLLGGYATDALSADERRILFEAALDDQALFNALQNEDALKELLDDPVVRQQVRTALHTRRPRFWSRRWLFGVAVPAVAAVVVIAVMYRGNAPEPAAVQQLAQQAPVVQQPAVQQPAVQQPAVQEPKAEPQPSAPPALKKQKAAPARIVVPKLKAPPAAQPLVSSASGATLVRPLAAPAMAALRAVPAPMPEAVRQQFSPEIAGAGPLYQGSLVQYSLIRSDAPKDAVRVQVTTGIAGYLALYELDAAGAAKQVYPAGDVAARVPPNQAIQIPPNPIAIGDGSRLRLVLVPSSPPAVTGFLAAGQAGLQTTTIGAGNPPLGPLVVDIPVAR